MNKPLSSEEIWFWYKHFKKMKESLMYPKAYSTVNKLDHKRFCNIIYKIDWPNIGKEEEKEAKKAYVDLAKKYLLDRKVSVLKYVNANNLNYSWFDNAIGHLRLW